MSNTKEIISIAVLPFEDLSNSNEMFNFCRSFCMDLIHELSYFKQFNIIAYQSGSAVVTDNQINYELLDELDIDYYLIGSVRSTGEKVRMNAQLFHAGTHRLIWANRFENELSALMALQESLLEELVAALQTQINIDLSRQFRVKQEVDFRAYELWLKGTKEVKKGTLKNDLTAREYFKMALDIEPGYSLAFSGMSLTYFNEWSCQLWNKWEINKSEAYEWAKKAIEQDEQNYIAAVVIGRILLFEGSFDSAEYFLSKSLALNSNDPDTLIEIASCYVYLEKLQEAEKLVRRAIRLNRAFAEKYYAVAAFVYFEMGMFDKAKEYASKPTGIKWIDTHAYFAAIDHCLNDEIGMRENWKIFLSDFSSRINNGEKASSEEAIAWMRSVNPFKGKSRISAFWEYISEGKPRRPDLPDHMPDTVLKSGFFVKRDDEWYFEYGDKIASLPEVKGFIDIHKLLGSPNEEFHCHDLMNAMVIQKGVTHIDEKAKKAYLERIKTIQRELEEADEEFDKERIHQLHDEYDQLIDFLSKSVDRKGRIRMQKDTTDKVRSAVTWRIRSAISKIEKANPPLGKHLSNSIKTGTYCKYEPEFHIEWSLYLAPT